MTWVALRFRQRGVVVGSLVVAAIADAFTTNGMGPFVESTPHASLMVSQTFVGVTALASLLVAAITSEREQGRGDAQARPRHARGPGSRADGGPHAKRGLAGGGAADRRVGPWKWDIQTNTVTWSDELYRIYGVTPDDYEPSYAAYLRRVHPDDRAHVEAAISGALDDREPFDYDERILRPDGSVRWLESRGQVYFDEDGRPLLMRGVCRDITERQRVKEALEEAKERARRVVEDAHEAFVAIDDSGKITDWNPQAEVTFGWSRAEAVGRPLPETIIPERYWPAHFKGLHRFLTSGESRVLGRRVELSALHRDGHEFPIEISISAVKTEDDFTFNALMHDISERKRAERTIQEAEERFRGAFEDAPIGMALMDLDGRFQQVNRRAVRRSPATHARKLEGTSFESITHPDDMAEFRRQMTLMLEDDTAPTGRRSDASTRPGIPSGSLCTPRCCATEAASPPTCSARCSTSPSAGASRSKLQHLADHDPLTGLLNRRRFERELDRHLDARARYGAAGALLVLDLDHFKYVNDSLGHAPATS